MMGDFLNAGAHNRAPKELKHKPWKLREEKWHERETIKGISFTKGGELCSRERKL